MDLNTATESGPAEGNAGTEDKAPTLDDAINQAMGGAEQQPEPVADARTETEPKTDEAQEQAKPDPAKAAEGDQKQEAPKEAIPDLKEAPKHWPEDRRQAFNGLDANGKAIVSGFVKDLTAGFTRKSQELSDKAKFHDAVSSLFNEADHREMQTHGVGQVESLKFLLDLNRFARQDPPGYIKWAMQHFKVAPEQILGTQPKPQGEAKQDGKEPTLDDLFADPRVDKLSAELEAIKAKEAERQRAAEDERRAVAIRQENAQRRAIREFREALDDDGNLAHPHFDELANAIGALMESHPHLRKLQDGQDKLALAYQMAVRADPELSKPLIERELQSRLEAERKREEAERAKRAGGIKRPQGAPTTRAKPASLDDAIQAAMSQAGV